MKVERGKKYQLICFKHSNEHTTTTSFSHQLITPFDKLKKDIKDCGKCGIVLGDKIIDDEINVINYNNDD